MTAYSRCWIINFSDEILWYFKSERSWDEKDRETKKRDLDDFWVRSCCTMLMNASFSTWMRSYFDITNHFMIARVRSLIMIVKIMILWIKPENNVRSRFCQTHCLDCSYLPRSYFDIKSYFMIAKVRSLTTIVKIMTK